MIQLGNSSDSWGVWLPDDSKQMHWSRVLDEIAQLGYHYVEIAPYGFFPKDPAVLNEELAKRGLKAAAGSHFMDFEDDSAFEDDLKVVREMCEMTVKIGAKYVTLFDRLYTDLVTGEIRRPSKLSKDEWKALIRNVNKVCKIISEDYGLIAAFHPHAGSHVETEEQIERFFDETDPKYVKFCLDTGQHAFLGGDVIKCLREHTDAICYLHIKNINPAVREKVLSSGVSYLEATAMGIWPPINDGVIDFLELKAVLKEIGYDGFAIVEHDCYPVEYDKVLPFEKKAYDYLKSIEFGEF